MVKIGQTVCPNCGGILLYYDTVRRINLSKNRLKRKLYIRRLRCNKCRSLHRELPETVLPYKQYEAEMILGVLDGHITSDTIGYENHPNEVTMTRWLSQKQQLLLWR